MYAGLLYEKVEEEYFVSVAKIIQESITQLKCILTYR